MSQIFRLMTLICGFSAIEASTCGMELNLPGKIFVHSFTPYDAKGQINLPTVSKIAKYYADNGLKNVCLMGYDGEGPSLSLKERKAILDAWLEQSCIYDLNIIPEVGFQPFVDSLRLARYCNDKNVSAITHFPEQVYQAENVEEAIEDLRRISEAAPNLRLIYNELLSTDPKVSTDAVILMRDQVPTLAGMETTIDTYLDIVAVPSICNYNLTVLIYDIQYIYAAFLLGLNSVSLGPNLFPNTIKAMETAADNCDRERLNILRDKLNIAVYAVINQRKFNNRKPLNTYTRSYFSYLKAGFHMISGIDVGSRLPLDKASPTEYKLIASRLRSLGVPLADSAGQW